jgi:hypothetical protein
MFSMTLSRPPEWFGTVKLHHGWTVSEVVEQRHGRAGVAERALLVVGVGEPRRSRMHMNLSNWSAVEDVVVDRGTNG